MGGNLPSGTMISALTAGGTGPAWAQAGVSCVGKWSPTLADCPSRRRFHSRAGGHKPAGVELHPSLLRQGRIGLARLRALLAGEEGEIGTPNFRLMLADETLQFAWSDGTKGSKLVRRPK